MDLYQSGQVNMFMNITGASEADAQDKLRAFRGDLNAAIDSYLSEKEKPFSPVQVGDADIPVWIDEDEPPPRITPPTFYPLPSAVPRANGWPRIGGFGIEGPMAPFPHRRTSPIVSQPRDIREIPIDWRYGESRGLSSADLLIEEIPATVEESPPSQRPAHFVTDDDEVTGLLPSAIRGGHGGRARSGGNNMGGDITSRHRNLNARFTNEVTTMASNEGDDIEEGLLKAAIEASQIETTGMGISEAEENDFVRAVSMSLKTAEQEKALREGKEFPWFSDSSLVQDYPNIDNREKLNISKRRGLSSAKNNFGGDLERMKSSPQLVDQEPNAPADNINYVSMDQAEDRNELEEQPLLRRRSGPLLNPTVTSWPTANPATSPRMHQESSNIGGTAVHPLDSNDNVIGIDEWGGLSSEEQEEAVMLEAAMFGSLPENVAMRFRFPSVVGGNMGVANGDFLDTTGSRNNARPIQQPPSPTVVAQRQLREQQDEEYIASLVADREKEEQVQLEEKARCLKEAEAKAAAHADETLRQEAENRKCLAEEENKKRVAAKQAALPEEPSIDDDNAVSIMVRMPDGTRQGRRFRKSESLQCLLDFIDVSCGSLPGSYRLVRPFPRTAFTGAEHGRSFHELGLNSKYETLFLELV